MIELYYFPSNASFAPHVLLQELGVPFQLRLVDRDRDEHKSPEFLKLNPNGLLPALGLAFLAAEQVASVHERPATPITS